jgi:hypothetical protein
MHARHTLRGYKALLNLMTATFQLIVIAPCVAEDRKFAQDREFNVLGVNVRHFLRQLRTKLDAYSYHNHPLSTKGSVCDSINTGLVLAVKTRHPTGEAQLWNRAIRAKYS